MGEFLSRQFTFSITGTGIALGLLLVLLTLSFIFFYVNRLQNKLHNYEKPSYGFLGKPIYPIVATLMVSMAVLFSSVNFDTQQTIDVKADTEFDVVLNQNTLASGLDSTQLELTAVPVVEGKQWGDQGDVFDIYWNISGAENLDRYEFIVSRDTPSKLELDLAKGDYKVKFTVVFRGRSFIEEKNFTVD